MVISRAWHTKPPSSVKSKSAFVAVAHPNGTFPNTAPCPASGRASTASKGQGGPFRDQYIWWDERSGLRLTRIA